MAVGRVWDADNGVWQRIGGPPNVVDPTEPLSPLDGLIWTNPTDGVSQIWDEDNDEWIVVGTGADGGAEHVVHTVEPVAPEDGLLWTSPTEISPYSLNSYPRGVLGYAQVTTGQGSIVGTVVDLTGLSVTVTIPASRRIRVSAQHIARSTVLNDNVVGFINEDGADVQRFLSFFAIPASSHIMSFGTAMRTPSAGTHTYKLRGWRATGTGTVDFYADSALPAYILVEDIGAV